MPAKVTRESLLRSIQRSPDAAGARDTEGWLLAFTPNACVRDPVGSPPNVGKAALLKFHSVFIHPNKITFDVKRDFVDVKRKRVVRIVDIRCALGYSEYGAVQPAHVVYDMDDELNITALSAYWEFVQAKPFGDTWVHYVSSLLYMARWFVLDVLLGFGVVWTAMYTASLFVGPCLSGGKTLVNRMFHFAKGEDWESFQGLFTRDCEIVYDGVRGGRAATSKDLYKAWVGGGFEFSEKSKSSGWSTTVCYKRVVGKDVYHGVLVVESVPSWIFSSAKHIYVFEEKE